MCGVAGIFIPASSPPEASVLTVLALHELQHRGEDAAGITSYGTPRGKKGKKKTTFYTKKDTGLVGDIFTDEKVLKKLSGNVAIGHVRYATSGSEITETHSVQPMHTRFTDFAIAHNGHIPDGKRLRKMLIKNDREAFQSNVDTEVIQTKIRKSRKKSIEDRICDALNQIEGAYALVILAPNKLIGVRDPNGFRPLVLGELENGGFILASETCSFPVIGAKYVRHIKPGEMVVIDENGVTNFQLNKPVTEPTPCIFEEVYFSRPDSMHESGEDFSSIRERLGAVLADEASITADCVVPIPDSANQAAVGFANQSELPLRLGLIRNHNVGRVFIKPTEKSRNFYQKLKHSGVESVLKGSKVILIDDSIVRGRTIRQIIEIVRECGAREVHVAVTYPLYKYPCMYGIATPTKKELIANSFSSQVEDIRISIGADSLYFLSHKGMLEAINRGRTSPCTYCDACATGKYPIRKTE